MGKILRALMIDDEKTARVTLERMLTKYCPNVDIIGEAGDVVSGAKLIKQLKPELVFLDIRIGSHTGFDLLDLLNSQDFHLVFVTAYDEYAVKAFEVNAVDYLLKPIDPDRLQQVVERCQTMTPLDDRLASLNGSKKLMEGSALERIIISNDKGHHFIELADLVRISSDQGLLRFWQQGKESVQVVKNIGDYEKLLPSTEFFRCHQSHLISKRWISSYLFQDGGTIVMKDDTQVPLARTRRDAFNKWLKG